jgi:hypothetical protein
MVRIKFKTKQDQVNGFYELATKGRVRSLPDDFFEIADRYLKILDEAGIAYEIVQTEVGQINEAEAVRNSLTVDV